MRKALQIFLWITILAVLGGLGWLFWPENSNTKTVREPEPAGAQVVAGANTIEQVDNDTPKSQSYSLDVNVARERIGNFNGLNGYEAGGSGKLITANGKRYIRLEDSFFVKGTVDAYVFVGGQSKPEIEVARLKGESGAQNYELGENIDSNGFDTVWIASKDGSKTYAKASL